MNNLVFSNRRKIKHTSFDLSHQGNSNELHFIFLQSLDAEIFVKMASEAVM